MNMIEKVARAIADKYAPAVDHRAPYAKIMMVEAAKAAILAMREPTKEMCEGTLTDPGSGGPDEGYETEVWQNMIDAALKEE